MAKEFFLDIGWNLAALGKSIIRGRSFIVQKREYILVEDSLGQRSIQEEPIDFRDPDILNKPFVAETEERKKVTRTIIPKPTT